MMIKCIVSIGISIPHRYDYRTDDTLDGSPEIIFQFLTGTIIGVNKEAPAI